MTLTPNFQWVIVDRVKAMSDSPTDWLPCQAHDTDTGYDVRSAESDLLVMPGRYVKIRLGIKMFAPEGWWLEVRPRSSTFIKHHVQALYGVIDQTYENELCFVGQYVPDQSNFPLKVEFGQKIAQIIPHRLEKALHTEISEDEFVKLCQERGAKRGQGGFGSSGKF